MRTAFRTAVLLASFTVSARGQTQVPCMDKTLDQGWNCQTQWKFWYTPQGSWIIPYEWFLNLNLTGPNGTVKSLKDAVSMDYSYVPVPAMPAGFNTKGLNPDNLPIGFTVDGTAGQRYLGITCAACHTAQIKVGPNWFIVNGAPSHGDFFPFLQDLTKALQDTRSNPTRFKAFQQEVLQKTGGTAGALVAEFDKELASLKARVKRNKPVNFYGRGRVDAFSHIFNQVVATVPNLPDPANAPVSYPALWQTPQLSRVQWNGSASNSGTGPLLRNVGEALGVFGRFWSALGDSGYGIQSTARVQEMENLEGWLGSLRPPKLPPDSSDHPGLAAEGEGIYKDEEHGCVRCHELVARTDLKTRICSKMVRAGSWNDENSTETDVVGTEDFMAKEFLRRKSGRGFLRLADGDQIDLLEATLRLTTFLPVMLTPQGQKHPLAGQLVLGAAILNSAAGAMSEKDALEILLHPIQNATGALQDITIRTPQYKAGPLNGIWATAPYLHNGSVATLADLLLTRDKRRNLQKVCMAGTEFDSENVGFKNDLPHDGCSQWIETSWQGSGNDGHYFGSSLSADDRKALIEFLKTL